MSLDFSNKLITFLVEGVKRPTRTTYRLVPPEGVVVRPDSLTRWRMSEDREEELRKWVHDEKPCPFPGLSSEPGLLGQELEALFTCMAIVEKTTLEHAHGDEHVVSRMKQRLVLIDEKRKQVFDYLTAICC